MGNLNWGPRVNLHKCVVAAEDLKIYGIDSAISPGQALQDDQSEGRVSLDGGRLSCRGRNDHIQKKICHRPNLTGRQPPQSFKTFAVMRKLCAHDAVLRKEVDAIPEDM